MPGLSNRILLTSPHRPLLDEQGFVLPLPASEVVPAAELLRHSPALIVAPPWTGKTFVSEKLHELLKDQPDLLCARTCFETLGRDAPVQPSWWDGWTAGEGHACWIVDAVDEDERSGDRRIYEVLDLLDALPKGALARLQALFFCRESEVPPDFLRRAGHLFGPRLRRLRLAGLDRESARALVGEDAFDRVCRLIEESGLRELAALPAVLEHLKGSRSSAPLDRLEVWRGVLRDLLGPRPGRPGAAPSGIEAEDRFEVAQWLAALLTFGNQRELRLSDLESLIPREVSQFRLLRVAAREALQTAVFEPAGDGGFRFAQDHVREWFAALALRDMPLLCARPLLTDESGEPNPVHAGVLDLLARIARDPRLRGWIEQAHKGGVVPPSGSLPWTAAEVFHKLDRLLELARTSPWGAALDEERLGRLAVPGLGGEIARRLDAPLSPSERELLLDVALATAAAEALEPALRILQDEEQSPRARALAADLLGRLAGDGQLASLEPWVRSRGEEDAGAESAVAILASAFHRKGLWDFEAAAAFALSRNDPAHEWLQYHLAEELTLDRARRLPAEGVEGSPLARRSAEALLRQDEVPESDWRLLLPRALGSDLADTFGPYPEARRRLFLEGLAIDPEGEKEGAWRWKTALLPEDAGWLLNVVRDRRDVPEWLLETLFSLGTGAGRSERQRVRQELKARDSGLLERLDRERRRWRPVARSRTVLELPVDSPGRLWLDQPGLLRPSGPAGQVPVAQVVRLLQDSRYRLLRTHDDLQAVILEELERIAADAKSHLAMLYRPRDKSGHLHEDALQAYLHCRLSDRLTFLEPRPIFKNRETLAARNTRNDLKIETTSLDNKPLTLIIEVKWSDNAEVSTSLVEQLGKGYLLENGLTHGIYLVGWCGRGASRLEALRELLDQQAREQTEVSIVPVVLDLTWD